MTNGFKLMNEKRRRRHIISTNITFPQPLKTRCITKVKNEKDF